VPKTGGCDPCNRNARHFALQRRHRFKPLRLRSAHPSTLTDGRTMSRTDKNAMAQYVKVVEAGSFQSCAREGLPVSTLSRKIAELEKALGVRLLERSTRQLRMTDIGRDYFELCRRGLTEFDAADALMTDRRSEISGRLRISIRPACRTSSWFRSSLPSRRSTPTQWSTAW